MRPDLGPNGRLEVQFSLKGGLSLKGRCRGWGRIPEQTARSCPTAELFVSNFQNLRCQFCSESLNSQLQGLWGCRFLPPSSQPLPPSLPPPSPAPSLLLRGHLGTASAAQICSSTCWFCACALTGLSGDRDRGTGRLSPGHGGGWGGGGDGKEEAQRRCPGFGRPVICQPLGSWQLPPEQEPLQSPVPGGLARMALQGGRKGWHGGCPAGTPPSLKAGRDAQFACLGSGPQHLPVWEALL